MIKKSESLKKKGWEGGKNKGNLETDETTPLRRSAK